MSARHEDQFWLVAAPADFRASCAGIDTQEGPLGTAVQKLAATRLNTNQMTRLSTTILRAQERGASLAPLSPFRLSVLGNGTTCLYVPALPAAAARHGVELIVAQAEYDQVTQEALNPNSRINTSKPDAILLALDFRGVPFGSGGRAALAFIEMVRQGLEKGCGAPVILQTVACPPGPIFGSLDAQIDTTLRNQISEFNAGILTMARLRGDYVLDVAAVAEMVGTQNWLDPVQWNLYKVPFSQSLVPVYVEHVARVIGSIRGTSRKCLVLDLDNTLWGGVIGDDGLEGIAIGQGDATAEAHLEVQKAALGLRERGIILAVCSKNDDAVARQPFRELPDMLLREEHIAVFQANWRDKATNLEAIAKLLNIGLDSLVFLDDNPVERKQVREALPMVAVPELPADPSLFPRTLLNAGYFEAVSFSDEDKKRASLYQVNAQRAELASGARNMDEFLQSLDMKIEIDRFTPVNLVRISQLINKTNQFNLTTRRYTQAEVEAMMHDTKVLTFQARLIDRFDDNGIISVIIGRMHGDACDIDTWLMSCRVLNRRVEEALLNDLAVAARAEGAKQLTGSYRPSPKNSMVSALYDRLGFELAGDEPDGSRRWSLDLETFSQRDVPFKRV